MKSKLTTEDIKSSIERLSLSGFCGGEKINISIFESRTMMQEVMAYLVEPYVWRAEYDQVVAWLTDNRGRGLMVAGPCGTGKSLICGKVIPILLQQTMRKICAMYTAREMNTRYQEMLEQKIIYIDDVGTEPMMNDYGEKRWAFSDLVDEAERKDVLLIATTNLDPEHLAQRYGDRTLDRLRGLTKLVAFTGKSLRRQ